jgi:hypothetical protein
MDAIGKIAELLSSVLSSTSLLRAELQAEFSLMKTGEFNFIKIGNINLPINIGLEEPKRIDRVIVNDTTGQSISIEVKKEEEGTLSAYGVYTPFRTGIHYILEDPELFYDPKAPRGLRPWISINDKAVLVPAASAADTVISTLDPFDRKITIQLEDCTPVSLVASWHATPHNGRWREGEPIELGHSTWMLRSLGFDTPHVVSPDGTAILTIRPGYCRAIWYIRRDHVKRLPEHYFLLVDIAKPGGI